MPQEVRPRIQEQLKEEVENIHQIVTNDSPPSFQAALELTCTLAYEAIEADLQEDVAESLSIPGVPEEWMRLDQDFLRIVDEELPETWKQSQLVAERIQKVVREFLEVRWSGGPLIYTESFEDGDEYSLRDTIKESFERARRDTDSTVSLSAVRTTCYARLYPNADSPANQFREALKTIQTRAVSEGYDDIETIYPDQ